MANGLKHILKKIFDILRKSKTRNDLRFSTAHLTKKKKERGAFFIKKRNGSAGGSGIINQLEIPLKVECCSNSKSCSDVTFPQVSEYNNLNTTKSIV